MSEKLKSEPESILVVDDDIGVRTIFSSFLKKEGYRVTAVKDGSEAIKAIDEGSFALALVDLRMPWLDGIEVLESIKNRKPQIPVIIYTGSGSVATAVEAMRKGAADYLIKPFSRNELKASAKKALKMTQTDESRI
ncbi:Transcriptional regulatory protein ZraR [subsurface metagenome]